jgi:hypothetical protein
MSRDMLIPGPLVLERHQLVDVGLAVDDALVGGDHAVVIGLRSHGARRGRWGLHRLTHR